MALYIKSVVFILFNLMDINILVQLFNMEINMGKRHSIWCCFHELSESSYGKTKKKCLLWSLIGIIDGHVYVSIQPPIFI